jgi:cell division protein ZipA
MAEELRLAFMLLGSLAIGAVVLHGIWTVRKSVNEEKQRAKQLEQETAPEIDEEEISEQALKIKQMEMNFADLQNADKDEQGLPVANVNLDSIYQEKGSKTEPEEKSEQADGISSLALDSNTDRFDEQNHDVSQTSVEALDTESEEGQHTITLEDDQHTEEPSFSFSAIDDVEDDVPAQVHTTKIEDGVELESSKQEEATSQATPEKQDVLILFVDKPEGEAIEGAKLLPLLLTLGFKFGEMEFFHRHESSSGQGEVLFSLANMYNPGTFDIDNMEQMTTRGLSIFMTLPNAGEALQTFNMMHNAAKKIADEFGAQVLDQNRQKIDVSIVRGYVERIRKF